MEDQAKDGGRETEEEPPRKKPREAQQNVNVTGVTGGSVGTANIAGIVYGGMGNKTVTEPDQQKKLLKRTKEEIEVMTAGMIRVSAVDEVVNKMNTGQHWITITGNAGDGKTTLGYLVLKEFLQKEVKVFTIYKPEEYNHMADMEEDRVIMFDDRFGEFLADHQLIKSWCDVIRNILRLSKRDKPTTKVLFISRKNVLKESKVYLGHFTDDIFNKGCVVDLSKRNLTDERLMILEYHLGCENVTIAPDIKHRVCKMQIAHGFPHCCKMFSKLKSKGNVVTIEEFFESPLKFLDITTRILYKENCNDLFQLMIKNNGQIDINSIEDDKKRQALREVEKEQENSYITVWCNGLCRFAHPSVYESVLNVINEIDPLYCVKYATLTVIRQKMLIATSGDDNRSKSSCYIVVKPETAILNTLAKRFHIQILKGDYSVFRHRLCKDNDFCKALVSNCVNTNQEKNDSKQFINKRGNEGITMLWTALRGGRLAAVQSLMNAGADVSLQDERGITPLCYLCQLYASATAEDVDVDYDDYDDSDYDDYDDDNDDDGDGGGGGADDDMDTIRVIIPEGRGDVNTQDERGRTPLHYLCQAMCSTTSAGCGDKHSVVIDTIRMIITEGRGDVNTQDRRGRTQLHYLCQAKCSTTSADCGDKYSVVIDTIRMIITEGRGDVNIQDEYGQTPLHFLSQLQNSITATAGAADDLHYQRVVMNAIRVIITEGRGDVNIHDRCGQTPLHYLLKCRALTRNDINWVITDGKGDLSKCEQHASTPLHYLCAYSGLQLDTLDIMIRDGDFNKGDEHGTTPLHYLCNNRNVRFNVILQIVKTAKGDINKQDDNGITPLHVFCKTSLQIKDILTLIHQGDKADRYGNTPLHFLCRRRGINNDVLQHHGVQIPETEMKKENILGYTPLDYLTDQVDRIPWTDLMIHRLAADLVIGTFNFGGRRIVVLAPAMNLNSERVHGSLQVEDFSQELNNMARSGYRNRPGQFGRFYGTCSSPVPVPPSPFSLPTYWETHSRHTWRKIVRFPLLEMGVVEGEDHLDERGWVSRLPGTVCVSVEDLCLRHVDRLCIQVLRRHQGYREDQVGECVTLPLPTPGEEFIFKFGLVLDVGRGRVGFIDVERGEILGKVDRKFTEWVFPMFCVNPFSDLPTRMRLVSGREISINDRKIQLIQQVLSD